MDVTSVTGYQTGLAGFGPDPDTSVTSVTGSGSAGILTSTPPVNQIIEGQVKGVQESEFE